MEKNMTDKLLMRFAVLASIVGLIMLLIIMYLTPIREISITEINNNLDRKILVNGVIEKISQPNSKITLFSVSSVCKINVTVFDEINPNDFSVGTNVSIQGKAQEYQGKTSIIADKIILTR